MKASEIVALLEDLIQTHGDIPLHSGDEYLSHEVTGIWIRKDQKINKQFVLFSTGHNSLRKS